MTQAQRALLLLTAAAVIGLKAGAQVGASTAESAAAAKAYTTPRHDALTKEFENFLSISDVAADPEGLKKNAAFLVEQLKSVGAETKLLTAPGLENVPPVVWGEIKTPGATRTIVFYAHYDGQPVTPSEWTTGKPFTPYLKTVDGEERVYARGAGDDKAAIFAQLTALRAIEAAHLKLNANIRFVWEGEEEAGSAHLEQILKANRDLIGGDIWLVCDGPVDQTREQSLAFGARGDTHVQITVFGPNRPLHSGHYGNWAPNPALELVQLLAGMKDANGHVLIPHFYDGIEPLGPVERKALSEAPVNDQMLGKELELGVGAGAFRWRREASAGAAE
jgi:acetylornithine deacetylase/succinyl-diaminopimelate desuccinylase-like protein